MRKAAGIVWYDEYLFHNGATSSAKALSFNWNDDEGYKMIDFNQLVGR